MAELQPQAPSPAGRPGEASSGRHPKPPGRELRKHLRFRVDDASAQLHVMGFLTSIGLGRANQARAAVNLSEGGVLLLVRKLLAPGTRVRVRIEMEKYADVIEAEGVVQWCEPSARSEKDYYAGIAFTGLAAADLKKIAQMREWFHSPEYQARRATRRRLKPPPLETTS